MYHIIHTVPMCTNELIEAYREQASATVHEAMGRRGALNPAIKPLDSKMKVVGRALTVKCHPADNLMIVKAINMAQENDVIVVNMGGLVDIGPFGGVLATECKAKKLGGLVFDCSVRDSAEIIEMGLPVFSNGLCIRGTAKAIPGYINHEISCGDELVRPGDIVLGDADGVVIVPLEEAEKILKLSQKRVEKEEEYMRKLREGASAFDLYGYQPLMEAIGCTEEPVGEKENQNEHF